jgi:putative membrane protein
MGDYGNGSGGGMMGGSGGSGMMGGSGGGMMSNFGGGMAGGMVVWSVVALILLIAVVVAIVFLIIFLARRSSGPRETRPAGRGGGDPAPADILRRRFASGEIDDEEFKRRLAVIN